MQKKMTSVPVILFLLCSVTLAQSLFQKAEAASLTKDVLENEDTLCRVYGTPDIQGKTFRGQISVIRPSESADGQGHLVFQLAKDAGSGDGILSDSQFPNLQRSLKTIAGGARPVSLFTQISPNKFQYNFANHPAGASTPNNYILDGKGCHNIKWQADNSERNYPWFKTNPTFATVMDVFALYYADFYIQAKYSGLRSQVSQAFLVNVNKDR